MKSIVTYLILISSVCVSGQIFTKTYVQLTNNRLCSHSITINSNNTYTDEFGCENRSNSHFGKWIKLNDTTLQLMPNDVDLINSIEVRSDTFNNKMNTIKLKVIDVIGAPIDLFPIILYKNNIDTNNLDNLKWNSRSSPQYFETDKNGFLNLNCSIQDSIEFTKISILNKKVKKYTLHDFIGKEIIFQLNCNGEIFSYDELNIFKREKPDEILLKKNTIRFKDSMEIFIAK